jgi:hypothetical protein
MGLSFGALNDKDYKNIHHVMEAFKNLSKISHECVDDAWMLKRATFMVRYLKDQIHHINLTFEETQKLALTSFYCLSKKEQTPMIERRPRQTSRLSFKASTTTTVKRMTPNRFNRLKTDR